MVDIAFVGQSPFSARADGSQFSAVISDHTVPELSTLVLMGTACLVWARTALSRRRRLVLVPDRRR